jgi:hypothetical protein
MVSTPGRIAPMRSGRANTAPTPRATAVGANTGHRASASGPAMLADRTGPSWRTASTPGPSPRVSVSSSTCAAVSSSAYTVSRSVALVANAAAVPSTLITAVMAAQTCPIVTAPPPARSITTDHSRRSGPELIATPPTLLAPAWLAARRLRYGTRSSGTATGKHIGQGPGRTRQAPQRLIKASLPTPPPANPDHAVPPSPRTLARPRGTAPSPTVTHRVTGARADDHPAA